MTWDLPNEIDLSVKREMNKNVYGFGQSYVEEIDLFGEKDLHNYKSPKTAYTPQNVIKFL